MGFLRRVLGQRSGVPLTKPAPQQRTLVMLDERAWPQDVEVAGETYHQDSIRALFHAMGDDSGGVLNRTAVLHAEPDNPYDPSAVAVVIDGFKVGHLPAGLAPQIQPLVVRASERNQALGVPARVWARNDGSGWGARITLSADEEQEAEWTYARQALQRRAAHAASSHGVDASTAESLLGDSDRVSQVRGKHYSEWTTTVENWKRAERYDEALALLAECQRAAVSDGRVWNRPPAPWYFEQAAIIHRKRKNYPDEVAVLTQYIEAVREVDCSRDVDKIEKLESRLHKARKLAEKS